MKCNKVKIIFFLLQIVNTISDIHYNHKGSTRKELQDEHSRNPEDKQSTSKNQEVLEFKNLHNYKDAKDFFLSKQLQETLSLYKSKHFKLRNIKKQDTIHINQNISLKAQFNNYLSAILIEIDIIHLQGVRGFFSRIIYLYYLAYRSNSTAFFEDCMKKEEVTAICSGIFEKFLKVILSKEVFSPSHKSIEHRTRQSLNRKSLKNCFGSKNSKYLKYESSLFKLMNNEILANYKANSIEIMYGILTMFTGEFVDLREWLLFIHIILKTKNPKTLFIISYFYSISKKNQTENVAKNDQNIMCNKEALENIWYKDFKKFIDNIKPTEICFSVLKKYIKKNIPTKAKC